MTRAELQQYREQLLRDYPLDPLYVPRRFTALAESGSVSSDLEFRSYGMLREREPALKEVLTHPAIAIVADPGGGKSVVGRAAVQQLVADGDRVPVLGEIKQYRVDLSTLFRITTPAAILDATAHVDGVPLKRTYVLDGIDEIPRELLQRLGGELRDFISREPQAHFVCTARQAFYVANRSLLPSIPAVFHILPLADEDVEHYCTRAGIDPDRFMDAIHAVGASEEVRNPFILSVMVERFRAAGSLSKLRSDNLSYMIDRLIQSRPQVNAHRQRRALRMLGVAMETYSRNELTEEEALRVIREAMHVTEQESHELLHELYASILKRTGNGLSFQLASYGEYLAAEALEDASLSRLKELAFLDPTTPNDSWGNAVSYLVELNPSIRKAFVHQYPFWTLSASPVVFSDNEKDMVVNEILKELTANNQFVSDHPRIQVRRLSAFITALTESVLQKDLASKNDVVIGNALILLGVRGYTGAVSLAMGILSDRGRSTGARMAAVLALVNSGTPALVPKLLELVDGGDPLHINIVDLIGALTDEAQIALTLPIILRTDAGLSSTYYRFRELKSREALISVLRFFLEHPNDLNSIRAEGYVEPILKLIPRYWDQEIAQLISNIIDLIETNHIFPERTGPFRKLFEIAGAADIDGAVSRLYFETLFARGEAGRRRMYYVDQTLAELVKPATARWLIENEATNMIQNLAPYLRGEVRELLRPHSNGIIDEQDAASRRYWEEQAAEERTRKNSIALVQERLQGRTTLQEALTDFVELRQEHWPELAEAYRTWLAAEISMQLRLLDLERTIEWRDNSLWQPQVLPLLLEIVDRYELRVDPDEPLVFAGMSMDRNVVAKHYRRFGLSDRGRQTLERLLRGAPSNQALNELIRFVESAGIWSDEIAVTMRTVASDLADKGYIQITALNLLMQHGAADELLSEIARHGASEQLQHSAFEGLIARQHRPTIERSLARVLGDEKELRSGEVPMPNQTPLDWIAKIRTDFALPRLIALRARALRLELSSVTQLLSNTIGAINRRELVRVIRQQLNITPVNWYRWQLSQALEQERTAGIEEGQRTPFDEVIKKLKGATSLNRLLVMCEGSTDIPVFDDLVAQAGEVPLIAFDDVGGWPALRNKDPNSLLLGSKAVIIVMDGDQGRNLSKPDRPLTDETQEQERRFAKHGIVLHVLRRYGIENYFPQRSVERVLGMDLSAYFPVPEHVPFTQHLSQDSKGPWYRFRRWVALKLDLKMPQPRQPLYSKSRNHEVAKFMTLDDIAGTDLFEVVHAIARRARDLQQE
jgi:hypothetical protein